MQRPDQATVVEAAYAAVLQPDGWPRALALVGDHIGATGGMVAYQDLVGTGGFLITARLRDDLTELYLKQYSRNAYARAMTRMPGGKVVFADALAPREVIHGTAFHADILAPQKIEDHILMGHPRLTSATTSGGISFTLDARQREERDRAKARFQRLGFDLVRAVDLSLELARKSRVAQELELLLDMLPGAALTIDRNCRVVRANARAERLLATRDGLQLDSARHLVAARSAENQALASMLKAAVAVAAREEGAASTAARMITRPSLAPALTVVAAPLPPGAFAAWDRFDGGARALVRIFDPNESLDGSAALLRQAAGLTATEARVAALVAEGRTTPEVAALLNLSAATVRTHLARCFDKTGSRSQVALARLLASLSG